MVIEFFWSESPHGKYIESPTGNVWQCIGLESAGTNYEDFVWVREIETKLGSFSIIAQKTKRDLPNIISLPSVSLSNTFPPKQKKKKKNQILTFTICFSQCF